MDLLESLRVIDVQVKKKKRFAVPETNGSNSFSPPTPERKCLIVPSNGLAVALQCPAVASNGLAVPSNGLLVVACSKY